MSQDSAYRSGGIDPRRQNGITTGHLGEAAREMLPRCLEFRDWLQAHAGELCAIVGIRAREASTGASAALRIEMNGIAYGDGGWLAPHTDASPPDDSDGRLVAWMLYLTHPADGEWADERGGALRLQAPSGPSRVRPRFNRFAMFEVSGASVHAIERVRGADGWEHCRLALSGWIRGPRGAARPQMAVYRRTADWEAQRAEVTESLDGARALYGVFAAQREYGGLELADLGPRLEQIARRRAAHLAAPNGTVFVAFAPGPAWCILVLDTGSRWSTWGRRRNM